MALIIFILKSGVTFENTLGATTRIFFILFFNGFFTSVSGKDVVLHMWRGTLLGLSLTPCNDELVYFERACHDNHFLLGSQFTMFYDGFPF